MSLKYRLNNLYTTLVLLCSTLYGHAQNLLPNPGFDDINICCEKQAPCSPEGWFAYEVGQYVRNFNPLAPEYKIKYNGKSAMTIDAGSPHEFYGAYASACAAAPLLLPLHAGKTYRFAMQVAAKHYAVSELHVYFSDSLFPDLTHIKPTLTLKPRFKRYIRKRNGWYTLEATYTASGNERYVFVGMLKPSRKIKYKRLGPIKEVSRIYIDDMELTPLQPDTLLAAALDSATAYVYAENRRHDFRRVCRGSGNLFPDLLNEKIADSVTTLPGILNTARLVEYGAEVESDHYLFDLHYLNDTMVVEPYPAELLRITEWLRQHPEHHIALTGFVDPDYTGFGHLQFSFEHARAVARYLMRNGISHKRISIGAGGSGKIIGNLSLPQGRALNNRVEYELKEP